jgi:hypothetical protein
MSKYKDRHSPQDGVRLEPTGQTLVFVYIEILAYLRQW